MTTAAWVKTKLVPWNLMPRNSRSQALPMTAANRLSRFARSTRSPR